MHWKFLKTDKKAADKVISVYWFAILFIVAAAIVYMVVLFYGKPYDVRSIEADILTDKIADCISYAGFMREGILNGDFLETCSLNFKVEDEHGWAEEGQYFVEVAFKEFDSQSLIVSAKKGNENLKTFCEFGDSGGLPVCLERSFYTLDKQSNQFQVEILSIVRKTEKND